jgi:PTS system nitrogen regulatory IIA component
MLVVDAETHRRLLGIVSRRQIVTAYHRRMLERGLDEEGRAMDVAAQADEVSAPKEETHDVRKGLWVAVKRGGILSGIRAGIQEKVLDELAAFAAMRAGGDAGQLSQRLRERERLGSTGIGDGLALPHPHSEGLEGFEDPHVVIGLLKRPVDWDAFDGQPVDTVCLLIAPSGAAHLALLSRLAKALADPTLRGLLRQKAPRKRILQRLKSLEEETTSAGV